MNKLLALNKRNIKMFFASKSNIFFASFPVLILIVLHFVIFRKMNADSILGAYTQFGGETIDTKWFYWLSDNFMLATIIPIGAFSISLVALGQFVNDKELNAINDFFVSPVDKNTLLFSYLISSLIIGAMILGGFIVFCEIYYLAIYGVSFAFSQLFAMIGCAILSLILGNLFVMIIVSFVNRQQAAGAIGTVLGTMLGFICGAFVPLGLLGDGVVTALTLLPFLPLTVISKRVFFMNYTKTPLPKDLIFGELSKTYSYKLFLGNTELTVAMLLGIVLFFIVAFTVALILIFKKIKKKS